MNTNRFAPLSIDDASPAARPLMKASEKKMGMLPSPIAKAARSPALLKYMLSGFAAFEETSLSPTEREVVAMTVAFDVGCHYCMAMHSALLAREPAHAELLAALRAGKALSDARLEALRLFVRDVIAARGHVSELIWQRLQAHDFSEEQALEALLGVSVYLTSTLTNVLTEAVLDAPFTAFAWQPPHPV